MRKIVGFLVSAATLAGPLHAAPLQMSAGEVSAGEVHAGAFAGLRLRVPLGASRAPQPRAELALAPTLTRASIDGIRTTRVGEGLGLSIAERTKPKLTIAGIRADTALGLRSEDHTSPDRKLGISTGWVIAGGVLVAAGIYFAVLYKEAVDNTE